MIGVGRTHSRTSILSTHTHTHVHMHVHMSRVFDSLNCVFLCFEIMLIADPATQSLALTSRQHVSLSVLLNL